MPGFTTRAARCAPITARAGGAMLYAFCASHGVPHRKCGKLVVATGPSEVARLEALLKQAQLNGVEGVKIIDAPAVKALEPELACVGALHSPETGIIDSHRFMLALHGGARLPRRGRGVQHADRAHRARAGWMGSLFRRERSAIGLVRRGGQLRRTGRPAACARNAGLSARARTSPRSRQRQLFRFSGATGVFAPHLSRAGAGRLGCARANAADLAGRMRFGPDVEWVEEENYDVAPARVAAFSQGIRAYWPKLPDNALAPDYAGMRPKLTGPGEPAADFMVQGPQQHGLERMVHMFGIESPGSPARSRWRKTSRVICRAEPVCSCCCDPLHRLA